MCNLVLDVEAIFHLRLLQTSSATLFCNIRDAWETFPSLQFPGHHSHGGEACDLKLEIPGSLLRQGYEFL